MRNELPRRCLSAQLAEDGAARAIERVDYDHLFRFLDSAAERGLLLRENRALARRTASAVEALWEVQRVWAAAAAEIDRTISAYAAV